MKLSIMWKDGKKTVEEITVKRVFTIHNEEKGKSWLYYEDCGCGRGEGQTIDMTELDCWHVEKIPHNCFTSLGTDYCKRCENCIRVDNDTHMSQYFCSLANNAPVDAFGYCYKCKPGTAKVEKAVPNQSVKTEKKQPASAITTGKPKHVDIYTDGACKGNPGPGGWGSIVVFGGKEKELFGGESLTTNNRMELTAVISALSILKEPCDVTLTTDSSYVVNAIEKGWLNGWKKSGWKKSDGKSVLNPDLWKSLDELLQKHNVKFVWVKGHAGHPYNERCDKLASDYAISLEE